MPKASHTRPSVCIVHPPLLAPTRGAYPHARATLRLSTRARSAAQVMRDKTLPRSVQHPLRSVEVCPPSPVTPAAPAASTRRRAPLGHACPVFVAR